MIKMNAFIPFWFIQLRNDEKLARHSMRFLPVSRKKNINGHEVIRSSKTEKKTKMKTKQISAYK